MTMADPTTRAPLLLLNGRAVRYRDFALRRFRAPGRYSTGTAWPYPYSPETRLEVTARSGERSRWRVVGETAETRRSGRLLYRLVVEPEWEGDADAR